jgi:DNA-binding NarL/FixJ family response regulator
MLKVLIADDHKLFRDGLRLLLERHDDIRVVAETEDGTAAVAAAADRRPDLVLMDVSMPGLNGIEAARKLLVADAGIKVIMLSMHSDHHFAIEALKSGAVGYVLKDSAFEELLLAIRTVAGGGIFLSQKINSAVLREYAAVAAGRAAAPASPLSAREREVLQLLAEGKSTKETAARLNVSVKTVETHRKQIMDKLDIHSVAELTKYAIRQGLTSLE